MANPLLSESRNDPGPSEPAESASESVSESDYGCDSERHVTAGHALLTARDHRKTRSCDSNVLSAESASESAFEPSCSHVSLLARPGVTCCHRGTSESSDGHVLSAGRVQQSRVAPNHGRHCLRAVMAVTSSCVFWLI